jgi:hypothetical protein
MADAGPCVLPLAPDPEGRRQDAARVGLARGEVAGQREKCITYYDTVVLGGPSLMTYILLFGTDSPKNSASTQTESAADPTPIPVQART